MTNKTILAFAFLDAAYRQLGSEFHMWHEMLESDREEHLITAALFAANPHITARQTHEAWVERKLANGWWQAEEFDPENKTHVLLVPFDTLPSIDQEAEEAGVAAMREALPHARENRLPPHLEAEVAKNIAVSNANFYLEIGDALGLDPVEQPTSMLFWGSLANARNHADLLRSKEAFTPDHEEQLHRELETLGQALETSQVLEPAVPGGRRDQGPFDCLEDDTEHGLLSFGGAHLNEAMNMALVEASGAGYCQRCLIASQVASAVTVLISGSRAEGMSDAEIMTVISDLIMHAMNQADAGKPLPHEGYRQEILQ